MTSKLNFIDLAAQYKTLEADINTAIKRVLDHGQYILGPEVSQFEKDLGKWTGTSAAVGVANGTDALVLALRALNIGPGDAVFTSSFSFFASAEAIALVGAQPVFTDINPLTYNMCPTALEKSIKQFAASNSSLRPAAVIPVDLFGLMADYTLINKIAKAHNLKVIEDGAQSFGATHAGAPVGALADIATTSFFPAKPLGCYGDGGAVFSVHDTHLEKVRSLRVHGKGSNKYDNVAIGTNSRLDTIQAAILQVKLSVFKREIELRNSIADKYTQLLSDKFHTPDIPENSLSTWAQYCLRPKATSRDKLLSRLKEASIPSAVYYRLPLHLQPALSYLNYKNGDFPVAESMSEEIFSIPMHPYLDDKDIERITDVLLK